MYFKRPVHYRKFLEWEPNAYILCESKMRGKTTDIYFLVTCEKCQEMPEFKKMKKIIR